MILGMKGNPLKSVCTYLMFIDFPYFSWIILTPKKQMLSPLKFLIRLRIPASDWNRILTAPKQRAVSVQECGKV